MLLLGNHSLPTNRDELNASLHTGLQSAFLLPARDSIVSADGSFPALTNLALNLTGASMKPDYRPARPQGARQPAIYVRQFRIEGRPVRYEQSGINLELVAEDMQFDFSRDALGRNLLDPSAARHGQLHASIAQADLQTLFLTAVRQAAAEHDAAVEHGEIKLTSRGTRSAHVHLRVVASKKVFLTRVEATIHAEGRLDVDDSLNATFSGLSCKGEGMVGTLVAGMVRQEIKHWEGRSLPLATIGLGSLRLRDLHIRCENGLHVQAAFGS
jgi:hypothetical protein